MQSEYKDKQELLSSEKMENTTLKLTLEKTNQSYTEVDATLRVLRSRLEEAGSALIEYEDQIKLLTTTLEETEQQAKELSQSLIHEEANKRKLHNTIQELKGNIRVFCRVRPQLTNKNETKVTEMKFYGEDNDKIELSDQVESTLGKVAKRTYQFQFDRVFTPEADQLECFEEISQLIQSALDGYNVCIFAYGQTGSGKTYTMQGPDNPTETTVGMIPRAVQQIYDIAQELKSVGWEYSMEGQFMEIYNETIHDLLGDASAYGKIKHDIHHDKHGNTTITDMNTVVLDSPSKVKNMLRRATMNRATGATNINERSSRSHSVFMLRLSGYNSNTGQRTEGILNLIDLAGSERLSSSGSVGDRLREAQAINKSLSCLGDVIHALVNNKEGGHIPYRNSKLTYLLRNSLGGNCKTLMFVNVSPLLEHFGETLCSLRFATKVSKVRLFILYVRFNNMMMIIGEFMPSRNSQKDY
ncbi:P-loop containing nucleoside triphosphate hydrolase protein [Pilobolus umbonatus]|nr:P-loop containing nucleoside triphosphate hydrolase protein [Pilobolus umbonatus]